MRWAVENASAYSPLPFEAKLPARPSPNAARAASRRSWRSESGASVPSTIMIEPPPLGARAGPMRSGGGLSHEQVQVAPAAVVRHHQAAERQLAGEHPRGAADPGLEAEAGGARAGAERALARLVRARRGDRLERVLRAHGQRTGVAEPAVEALPDHHVDVSRSRAAPGFCSSSVPQAALPDGSHRERVGQQDGALERAELLELAEARGLAVAVDHVAAGEHLLGVEVSVVRQHRGDAGRPPAACGGPPARPARPRASSSDPVAAGRPGSPARGGARAQRDHNLAPVRPIATRAPLRVALGGGGTDLPSYYREHGGFVVSTAIDRYVHVLLSPSFQRRYRLKHLEWEEVDEPGQVRHPILREALQRHWRGGPLELASVSDAPPGTGLGSSGAYAVCHDRRARAGRRALAGSAGARRGRVRDRDRRARPLGGQAGPVRRRLRRARGPTASTPTTASRCATLELADETLRVLRDEFLLFFSGRERSPRLRRTVLAPSRRAGKALHRIAELARETCAALESGDMARCGELMNEQWEAKRGRAPGTVTAEMDDLRDARAPQRRAGSGAARRRGRRLPARPRARPRAHPRRDDRGGRAGAAVRLWTPAAAWPSRREVATGGARRRRPERPGGAVSKVTHPCSLL